ncbi:MAG: hypothetical protein PHW76_02300 [Alphaproteobacteria bacterium]|nr:hypothetical protein [Alphaproteobacteria bacterium]
MTETEKPLPSPQRACEKRKPFLWFLSGILLMTIAAFLWSFNHVKIASFLRTDAQEVAKLKQRVDALERQFNALVQLAPAQQAQNMAVPLDDELRKLKEMVESVEGQEMRAAHKEIAAAFACWDLRDEAQRGGSFDVQLAALREASDDPKVEEMALRLVPYAAGGTLTLPQLREELLIAEKNAPSPSEGETNSIVAKLKKLLEPLISVKLVHDPRFSEVEIALERGDVAGSLEALRVLPQELQPGLDKLKKHMEERADLDSTIKALTTYFMTVPAQRSAS